MYLRFFGFQRPPFELVPDPDFLFLGESHDAALANVAMGLESGKGFVVITGPVGAGKTTILRAMLRRIGREQHVCFLSQPESSIHDLLRAILDGFGVAPEGDDLVDLRRALRGFLERSSRPGILIVDEAHLLSEDAMEQLRLLSNLEEDHRKLLQIVLSGQRELKDLLSRPRLRPLAQRIEMYYEIEPLGGREVRDYIDRRLRIAGSPEGLRFEPRAVEAIHAITGGIPRLINVLADRALITAYVEGTRTIGEGTVLEAYEDLGEITQAVMPGAPARGPWRPRRTEAPPAPVPPPPPLPPRGTAPAASRPEARIPSVTPMPVAPSTPSRPSGRIGDAPPAARPRLRYSSHTAPARGRAFAWIGAGTVVVIALLSLGSGEGGLAAAIGAAGQAALQRTGLGGEATEEGATAVSPEAADVAATGEPAPTTEPPVSRPPDGPFAIQIASFRSADRAREFARAHRERSGERARVSPTEVETGLWYRVLVGEFATREEVDLRLEELRKDGEFSFLRTVRLLPGDERSAPATVE